MGRIERGMTVSGTKHGKEPVIWIDTFFTNMGFWPLEWISLGICVYKRASISDEQSGFGVRVTENNSRTPHANIHTHMHTNALLSKRNWSPTQTITSVLPSDSLWCPSSNFGEITQVYFSPQFKSTSISSQARAWSRWSEQSKIDSC